MHIPQWLLKEKRLLILLYNLYILFRKQKRKREKGRMRKRIRITAKINIVLFLVRIIKTKVFTQS